MPKKPPPFVPTCLMAIIIHEEDVSLNRRMAEAGSTLFEGKKNIRILTHCNAVSTDDNGIN